MILKSSIVLEIELLASFENTFGLPALKNVPNLIFFEKNSQ